MNVAAPCPSVDPRDPWKLHSARIVEIRPEINAVVTYTFEWDDEEVARSFCFHPGQFCMVYVPGFGESAISISSSSESPHRFAHTIRAVGNVTRALTRCKVGDRLLLRGPFGSAWPVALGRGQDLVLAAGGLGLAPLRPVVYSVLHHRADYDRVWLLYGARTPSDLLFCEEYSQWQSGGIEVQVTVDFGDADWNGTIGVVPSLLHRIPLRSDRTQLFTCGPEIMMRYVVQEGRSRGLSRSRIWLSMERNMSCALGFCGHCQYGPVFVCKDGPVFSYDQLESYLHVEDF